MTPQTNTLYSVCLYLSLCCLLRWTARRDRAAVRVRRSVAGILASGQI
jgi:hypothetical protein